MNNYGLDFVIVNGFGRRFSAESLVKLMVLARTKPEYLCQWHHWLVPVTPRWTPATITIASPLAHLVRWEHQPKTETRWREDLEGEIYLINNLCHPLASYYDFVEAWNHKPIKINIDLLVRTIVDCLVVKGGRCLPLYEERWVPSEFVHPFSGLSFCQASLVDQIASNPVDEKGEIK